MIYLKGEENRAKRKSKTKRKNVNFFHYFMKKTETQ